MSVILTSAISEILEKDILPQIEGQLNEETYLMKNIPKNTRHGFANNTIYKTLRHGRNESVRSIAASSTTLPTAGSQKRAQAQINDKYLFGTLNLDIRTLAHAEGNEDSIVKILTDETEGLQKDMAKDINRQLFRKGNGQIATVTASSTDTVITVADTKYIQEGQLLTINGDDVAVVNITGATTFTVTTGVTVATNEIVVKTNGTDEMQGLYLAADDGTYTTTFEGISTATNHWWKAYVDDTDETYTLSSAIEADMRAAATAVKKYGKLDVILTSFELLDVYKKLYADSQRFMNTIELKGGFGEAVTFDGVPVVPDFDCPAQEMYFIDWSAISLEYTKPMQFEKGTHGLLNRVTGSTYYEAVLYCFGNMLCDNRRKLAKLENKD